MEDVWIDDNIVNNSPIEIDSKTMRVKNENDIPKCPKCGALARPNVSFFSDTDYSYVDTRQCAQKERIRQWLDNLKDANNNDRLLIIELGCGTSIHSLRFETEVLLYHTPEQFAKRASFIRINPVCYQVEDVANCIGIPAGALPGLLAINEQLNKKP